MGWRMGGFGVQYDYPGMGRAARDIRLESWMGRIRGGTIGARKTALATDVTPRRQTRRFGREMIRADSPAAFRRDGVQET